MDTRSEAVREAQSRTLDRLRVTRELTKNQYNRLLQWEEVHGELSADEIAKKFNLLKQ